MTQCPTLFDKWHGILYMPRRIDTAGHTKALITGGGGVKERSKVFVKLPI